MVWIFEQQMTVLMTATIGVVALGIALFQTGRTSFLWLLGGWIALMTVWFGVELVVVTEREVIERIVYQFAADIRANDVDGVLEHISKSSPEKRQFIAGKLATYEIDSVSVKRNLEITFIPNYEPPVAKAGLNVVFTGHRRSDGARGNNVPTYLSLSFRKEDDGKWRVYDFVTYKPQGEQAGELELPR
ncbi:MAG: hypothetical protein COA78_25020 [Blastopirellula sp.]|nr:MAG: hypothetical protein COA78_25020 [Blastopirellula sp.]